MGRGKRGQKFRPIGYKNKGPHFALEHFLTRENCCTSVRVLIIGQFFNLLFFLTVLLKVKAVTPVIILARVRGTFEDRKTKVTPS